MRLVYRSAALFRRLVWLTMVATVPLTLLKAAAPENLDELRAYSLRLVNEARQKAGLAALQENATLNRTAQVHAEDMLARNFYGHASPEGTSVRDRFLTEGGATTRVVGENLARCRNCPPNAGRLEIARVHQGWMDSPGHRENILSAGYTHYGFAIAEDGTGLRYSVQTFAGPGTSPTDDGNGPARVLAAGEESHLAAGLINELRRANGRPELTVDPGLVAAANRSISRMRPLAELELHDMPELEEVLPKTARWRTFRMIAATCDGCGTEPTDTDVRFFVQHWRSDPQYLRTLLSERLSAIGVKILADRDGRKVAVAVLAGR